MLSSLLVQIDDEDLTAQSKKKLEAFLAQEFLDFETLKANVGVDPQAQIEVAKLIRSNPGKYGPMLQWTGIPKFKQIYGICDLIWKPFGCSKLGAGSAVNSKQLGVRLIQLHTAPTNRFLIERSFAYSKDADRAVSEVLDFLRLWASFHFPQLLRALDRIQKDVFRRLQMPSGDYSLYASKVENRFLDPPLIALEEYGIPLEIAQKLRPFLRPYENLDDILARLRRLPIDQVNLSGFERSIVMDAQKTI